MRYLILVLIMGMGSNVFAASFSKGQTVYCMGSEGKILDLYNYGYGKVQFFSEEKGYKIENVNRKEILDLIPCHKSLKEGVVGGNKPVKVGTLVAAGPTRGVIEEIYEGDIFKVRIMASYGAALREMGGELMFFSGESLGVVIENTLGRFSCLEGDKKTTMTAVEVYSNGTALVRYEKSLNRTKEDLEFLVTDNCTDVTSED